MKISNSKDFTYMGYLQQTWFDRNELDEREMHLALQEFGQMAGPIQRLMPMFFVLDYSTRNYLVFTDSVKFILGYDAKDVLDSGLNFTFEQAHQDLFKVYNQKVFPANMASLKKIAQHEHKNHIFSFNLQFRNRKGKYIHTLQRGTFITSKESGNPLYCVAMVVDISAYKRDSAVVQSVERVDPETGAIQTIETNYFYPHQEDILLTRQELNIVKYMADGLSSKIIALKLGLSENTIANHRKNMLRKTNTHNVAQLIAYVVRNGII